jgi:hypothetical protein
MLQLLLELFQVIRLFYYPNFETDFIPFTYTIKQFLMSQPTTQFERWYQRPHRDVGTATPIRTNAFFVRSSGHNSA